MNYPLISSGQVHAAASLAEAVADRYGCVGVISRAAVGTAALLDQTARELSVRRIRCVRVQGPAAGGLASRDLIAQIIARPDPGALTDADLEAGFKGLTEPGEGFRRVALLVSEAHSLLPSAVRYVQLARQASPAKLCVVLAGKPGLATALEGEDFIPLRSAMHMMELSEPAGAGLFNPASAFPEPPVPRAGGSSPLVRLGLAASIIPIVGLIWWRHLPEMPAATVPPLDVPSVSASVDAPSAPPAPSPPAAPPPVAAFTERAGEPAPPEPARPEPALPVMPQAEAGLLAADPAPAVATLTPEPPEAEAPAEPDIPADHGADAAAAAEPPPAAEPPASEPSAAVAAEPAAPVAEPSAAAAATEPPADPPERGEAPVQETDLAEPPAPASAAPAPDAGPPAPAPEPVAAAKPPVPHGTLTVTTAPPAQGGARRAAPPAAVPQAAAPLAHPAEDRSSLADEKRCRTIVFRAQLGKDPSDADKQFLRNGCHSG